MNTITVEGTITEDLELGYGSENGTPVCLIRLSVERPPTANHVYDPFFVVVVSYGTVARDLVERAARYYVVSVTGRLDCFEFPTDDGSHRCEHVLVATAFEVVSDVPF